MPIQVVIDNAISQLEIALEELPRVSAKMIGLDVRAGYVYVDVEERCIVAAGGSNRSLNYYGGFEYISEENITQLGDYTIYSEESYDGSICDRLSGALDYFEEHQEAS